MPCVVVDGSMLECPWGEGPRQLRVLPEGVESNEKPVATVEHCVPLVNIPSFGECISTSNPEVIAATAAAGGVLQPQPCIPVIATPWMPGVPTVMLNGLPVLDDTSICECAWAEGVPIRVIESLALEIHVP
jgi:hypothetical protein